MEDNNKHPYVPPVVEVVNVQYEGVICASGKYNGFGEEEVW